MAGFDNSQFYEQTQAAFDSLPAEFREMCGSIVLQVLDWPQDDVLEHFAITSRYGLLGLYHGISLDRKSVLDLPHGPDLVFLYRRPILAYAADRGQRIEDVIRHVLVHEIGHHFGLSDADMEAIELEAGD